jgi:hypothetical protein
MDFGESFVNARHAALPCTASMKGVNRMAPGTEYDGRFYERYSWLVMFGLGLLLSLSTLGITLMGADPPSQFESDTGVHWTEFKADYPTVATLVSLQELLIGTGYFGFSAFATVVAFTKFRSAERWAWYVMWLFPLLLAVATLHFFTHDQAYVGYFYAVAAVIALLAMLAPVRRFFPRNS